MVQNFEFQYFLGFQKKIGGGGGGMKILWIFLWGHLKIGLYLGVIFMHFRDFLLRQGTELGIFFGVAKISNIFLGCLKFLIFFLGEW